MAILFFEYFSWAIWPLYCVHIWQFSRIAKKVPKTILQPDYSCSIYMKILICVDVIVSIYLFLFLFFFCFVLFCFFFWCYQNSLSHEFNLRAGVCTCYNDKSFIRTDLWR